MISTSSLLGSQHVAVISDGALPTLWQMLRRFLIVLEVSERSGPLQHQLPFRKEIPGRLDDFDAGSLAGEHQKSKKQSSCQIRLRE